METSAATWVGGKDAATNHPSNPLPPPSSASSASAASSLPSSSTASSSLSPSPSPSPSSSSSKDSSIPPETAGGNNGNKSLYLSHPCAPLNNLTSIPSNAIHVYHPSTPFVQTLSEYCRMRVAESSANYQSYVCRPTPAYPEENSNEAESVCSLPPVKFTQPNNYKLYDKCSASDKEKIGAILKLFRELGDTQRKITIDGMLRLCDWNQLPYASAILKPLLRIDFLTNLPEPLVTKILSYLDATSLCQASIVCKKWKVLAEDDAIWRRMCDTHTGQKCRNCGWGLPKLEYNLQKRQRRCYKDVYAEGLVIARNWRNGRYQLKEFRGHTDGIMCIQMDSQKVATGSYDRDIRLWDIHTGECTAVMKGHERCVRCLQFDDEKLISGSMDCTIRIWCLKNGKCIRILTGHTEGVLCLTYDKTRLISGSVDCDIKVWDIKKGECHTLTGHTDWVNSVVIHNENYLFSASDDMTIRYWDLNSRQCIKTFEGHVGQVQCLQSLGQKLLSGSLDNTIKIWDIVSGECVKTLFGHVEGVWCVRFDTLRIVSGSHDKNLKIWDVSDGNCLLTISEHKGVINCLQLSDSRVVTGSDDGVARLFDFGRI